MSDEVKLSPEIDDAIVRNFYAMAYKNGGTYVKASDFLSIIHSLANTAIGMLDVIKREPGTIELTPVYLKLQDIAACIENFHKNDLTDMLVPKEQFRTIL